MASQNNEINSFLELETRIMRNSSLSRTKHKILRSALEYYSSILNERGFFKLAFGTSHRQRLQNIQDLFALAIQKDDSYIEACKKYCQEKFSDESNSEFKKILLKNIKEAEEGLHNRRLVAQILTIAVGLVGLYMIFKSDINTQLLGLVLVALAVANHRMENKISNFAVDRYDDIYELICLSTNEVAIEESKQPAPR